ncbi:unnamed protein product [Tilletia controversa]|nr:unnamed protein product [Tilletia controversa]
MAAVGPWRSAPLSVIHTPATTHKAAKDRVVEDLGHPRFQRERPSSSQSRLAQEVPSINSLVPDKLFFCRWFTINEQIELSSSCSCRLCAPTSNKQPYYSAIPTSTTILHIPTNFKHANPAILHIPTGSALCQLNTAVDQKHLEGSEHSLFTSRVTSSPHNAGSPQEEERA